MVVGEATTGEETTLLADCFERDELREIETSVGSVAGSAVPFGFLPFIVGDAVVGLGGAFLSSDIFRISTSLFFFALVSTAPWLEVVAGGRAGEAGEDLSFAFFPRTVLLRDGCASSLVRPFSSCVGVCSLGDFGVA